MPQKCLISRGAKNHLFLSLQLLQAYLTVSVSLQNPDFLELKICFTFVPFDSENA